MSFFGTIGRGAAALAGDAAAVPAAVFRSLTGGGGMPAGQGAQPMDNGVLGVAPPALPPQNPILGGIDNLLFHGAFGAAQRQAFGNEMGMYNAGVLRWAQSNLGNPDRSIALRAAAILNPNKTSEDVASNFAQVNTPEGATNFTFGGPTLGGQAQTAPKLVTDDKSGVTGWSNPVTGFTPAGQFGGDFTAKDGLVLSGRTGLAAGAYSVPQVIPPGNSPAAFTPRFTPSVPNLGQPSTPAPAPAIAAPLITGPTGLQALAPTAPADTGAAPDVAPQPAADLSIPPPPAPPDPNGPPVQAQTAAAPVTLQPPIAGDLRVTSGFGPRRRPLKGATADHLALDFHAGTGTQVLAAGDGVVVSAGPKGGYGNAIVIQHADGTRSLVAHLSRVGVKAGDTVRGGDPIGASGATGLVTAPHLHFAVFDAAGHPVDPRTRMGGGGAQTAAAHAQPAAATVPAADGWQVGAPVGGDYQIVKGTDVPNGDPHLNYKRAPNGDLTPMPPSFNMENVQTNRARFYASEQYKNATENLAPVKGLFDSIDGIAPGGVVTIAALDTLNKSLNPGGIVRPASVSLFLEHLGLPEAMKSHILNLTGQGALSPEVISQIGRASWLYARSHIDQARRLADQDNQLASTHGFKPEDVGETVPDMPDVPKWARDSLPAAAQRQAGHTYWGANGPMMWTEHGWVRK